MKPDIKYLLQKLLIYLFIYTKGLRFYKTCYKPLTATFREAKFITIKNHIVKFSFYREVFEDLYYKENRIVRKKVNVYIIQSQFDTTLPTNITKFNNLKFVFTDKFIFITNENLLTSILLKIHLKFIKEELEGA